MRSQEQMYLYLTSLLTSHRVTMDGNKIIGTKKKGYGERFSSFRVTYLNNGEGISYNSTSYPSSTLRFNDDRDLINILGAVACFSADYYKSVV